ncbi:MULTISPECIES: hypothetical protein [unclassified Chelatococcus]|uniref:DUF7674 family protein n=1 Tax=unclassified Chelatococcus TaxID=2638111 RepID=UPI001BCE3679|nr:MULTISPECIES: hypothetical protein [unclassified Chelatococcus]CAH1672503.1 conserved hypothetical protein [Hyphomicrobiales bacterium]MBS7738943.1 hypothetical protein [Chelatococcus sp. HY11]MBX3543376.1 hypothetical protein [Chelatococcus sp.]MCO5076528.1 hypothetical protein [Chelatococcus sp.]CAH1675261.1 conserved hypothetical protein [Hyphomicrobiales bacterium]
MITRADMIPLLIAADPSLEPQWRLFQEEWANDPEPPLYIALGELAHHVSGKLERQDTDLMPAIFAVVERWLADGDPYVQNAAAAGFLEDLQNSALNSAVELSAFRQWLGPLSLRAWNSLDTA